MSSNRPLPARQQEVGLVAFLELQNRVRILEQIIKQLDEYMASAREDHELLSPLHAATALGYATVDGYDIDGEGHEHTPRVGTAVTRGELHALLAKSAALYSTITVGMVMRGKSVGFAEYRVTSDPSEKHPAGFFVVQELGACEGLFKSFPREYEKIE